LGTEISLQLPTE
jgi:hypothetical protein